MKQIETMPVLHLNVAVTNLEASAKSIDHWIKEKIKTYVCVTPVAAVVEAQDDLQFRQIVNEAGMATPDGMPLVLLGKMKGHKSIERTYGPDLMLKLCDDGLNEGYRHFLYGGSEEVNEQLIEKLKSRFPTINIVGFWAPPIREKGQRESEDILKMINNAQPDILWVGLGSPKQEYWMYNHREDLQVPVMIGVGAAFDFLSGVKKQGPRWMQRCALEWLFRLCSEPKRLWRRYIIGNSRFIFLLFLSLFKKETSKA